MNETKERQDVKVMLAAYEHLFPATESSSVEFAQIERNKARRDFDDRRLYKVVVEGNTACLAFVGRDLAEAKEKCDQFAKAFPLLSVKTLGLLQTEEGDVLLSEYFPGISLEQCFNSGRLTEREATRIARNLYSTLQETLSESEAEQREIELEMELSAIAACSVFSEKDRELLQMRLFPRIREDLDRTPLKKIWTNGDFIARNVLVSERGECKLIDYEFTKETHFYWEDCLRWKTYSDFGRNDVLSCLFDGCWEWTSAKESLFILKQIELESRVARSEALEEGLPCKIARLRELSGRELEEFGTSFLNDQILCSSSDEKSLDSSVWERVLRLFRRNN